MQTLQLALFIVMLELTVGSFVSLYLLDLRGDTTRGFVVFQGALYLVFAGLTLLAMNNFATPELVRGYGLDTAWVRAQGPLTLLFSALMLVWNALLWADRQPKGAKKVGRGATGEKTPANPKRLARFGVGVLTALAGLVALFAVGMAYRTLADTHLGGAFVVLSFIAGGLAVGGVMTAMLLGHWYLNTPTASGKPLEFSTALVLVALALELAFSLFIGAPTPHSTLKSASTAPGLTIQTSNGQLVVTTPTVAPAGASAQAPATQQQTRQAPLSTGAMVWLQFIMGIIAPLVLGAIALWLTRGRSFQSATGMLYLCVSFIFIGEILGRGLLVAPIFF